MESFRKKPKRLPCKSFVPDLDTILIVAAPNGQVCDILLYQSIRLAPPGGFYRRCLACYFYLGCAGRHSQTEIQNERLPNVEHYIPVSFGLKAGESHGHAVR